MQFQRSFGQFSRISRRSYHPGFSKDRKVAIPFCPPNVVSTYYKPVWGNRIQDIQINSKTNHSYCTDDINKYSKLISLSFGDNIELTKTSHNAPVDTALASCRNLKNPWQYLKPIMEMKLVDENNVFINNPENRAKMLKLVDMCEAGSGQKDILESAIYGIFSNFGDSIYIANDYLEVDGQYSFISNYPDKASQRETERARIVATNLYYGSYPILLNDKNNFEGEANIKFLPAYVTEHGQKYQMCVSYDSSRSETTNTIANINQILKKLNLPLLMEVNLKPMPSTETQYYHLDCAMNFYSTQIQNFTSYEDFIKNYEANGVAIVAKDCFDQHNMGKINRLFKKVIMVDTNDDLLIANMVVMEKGIIGTSSVNPATLLEIESSFPKLLTYKHPSMGGGGAHKCCSNVITIGKEKKDIDSWKEFMKSLGINVTPEFYQAIKNEYNRLYA